MVGQLLITSLVIKEPITSIVRKVPNNSHKLKFHITHIAPNCSMITHSAKQNHPDLWVLADLDGRLLLCLGKMWGKQL
jgi:hypothetical protein